MADSAIPPLITFLAWIRRYVKGARRGGRLFTLYMVPDLCLFYVLWSDPIPKIYAQLIQCLPPLPAFSRPFFGCVCHCQIQHFEQGVIRGKHGPGFCHFSQLTVKILNGICSIDQLADFIGIFEIGG